MLSLFKPSGTFQDIRAFIGGKKRQCVCVCRT